MRYLFILSALLLVAPTAQAQLDLSGRLGRYLSGADAKEKRAAQEAARAAQEAARANQERLKELNGDFNDYNKLCNNHPEVAEYCANKVKSAQDLCANGAKDYCDIKADAGEDATGPATEQTAMPDVQMMREGGIDIDSGQNGNCDDCG